MNTMFMSDTSGHHEALLLPHGEMIIHAGNVTRNGTEAETKDFLQWFSHLNYKYRVFISGMNDSLFESDPGRIKRLLPANVIYLEESGVEIEGFRIWGSPFNTFNHGSAFSVGAEDIKKHWDRIPDNTDIIIGRTPAYGVQDGNFAGEHVGCQDLLRRLVRIEPRYFVCGNIHDTRRYEYLYDIHFINASLLNQEYKVAHKPVFLRNP
jgi:Icc-related predicted phosphoesterase